MAHGGHCVARVSTSSAPDAPMRVVFVRHSLPGERVVLQITEGTDGDRFWRADAVEVLAAAPERVSAPCPYSGPDQCGGCDFQHVDLAAQRGVKAQVVAEQLRRLAGLEVTVQVEAVPGDDHGLRWRSRQQYVALPDGRKGLRKHRSHEVVEIDECLLEAPTGPSHRVAVGGVEHDFEVPPEGFWQVHPGAPRVLVETVLDLLRPEPGERVLDLYAGVGLFARFLDDAVGKTGRVVAVEGYADAARAASRNVPEATVTIGAVASVLGQDHEEPFDLVVLDPPREGAKRGVVQQIADRAPRAVAYVACDPAALARDVAVFAESGYGLTGLRALDLFPMTHHVECVALLTKIGSEGI